MNITFHIEQVILEGFVETVDSAQIQFAIQQELTRLLAEHGLTDELAIGGDFATRSAKPIAHPAAQSQEFGGQIAGAIFGSLGSVDQAMPTK